MFPENKHLETFLVPNKEKPEPPSPVVEAIRVAISITIPITITLTLFETLAEFDITSPEVPAIPNTVPTERSFEGPSSPNTPDPTGSLVNPDGPNGSGEIPPVNPDGLNDLGEIPSDSLRRIYPNGHWIRIPAFCNGFHADAANFRVSPSLHVSAIKGIVLVGNRVFLTGERRMDIDGNGITWYGAFNELPLTASEENIALNLLSSNQEGWIADCFVE